MRTQGVSAPELGRLVGSSAGAVNAWRRASRSVPLDKLTAAYSAMGYELHLEATPVEEHHGQPTTLEEVHLLAERRRLTAELDRYRQAMQEIRDTLAAAGLQLDDEPAPTGAVEG
jgi:cysteinyl-tRNA synthetase